MIKKWKILESKEIFSSQFITLKEERLEKSDGKIVSPYYAIERPDVVYIIALTKTGELVLVYQYKNGFKDLVWELPAGFVDERETPIESARRELLEETGYSAEKLVSLGSFSSGLGLARNENHFFLARNTSKVSEQKLDENEEIEVKTFPIANILEDLKNGKSILKEVQSQLAVLLAERYL